MRKSPLSALFFFLLIAASAAFAQTAAPTKATTVEGITEYRLPNGLRILLFPDKSKPTVTVNMTYLVGSRHEGYGESGMAHLLEHMLFKGTAKRESIMKLLTEKGADWNGTTWFDRTNYFETLDATTDENLRWALEMEADRMVNSRVSRADLDSEMTVVRNEFERGENDNSSVLEERVMATAYLWHNYGRSTIGARSDIEQVPIERLQAFYRKYYQPDNSVLVIAGKFDEALATERTFLEKYRDVRATEFEREDQLTVLRDTLTSAPARKAGFACSLRNVSTASPIAQRQKRRMPFSRFGIMQLYSSALRRCACATPIRRSSPTRNASPPWSSSSRFRSKPSGNTERGNQHAFACRSSQMSLRMFVICKP